MSEMLIQAIGQIVSGDFVTPLIEGDSILIRNGVIAEIGSGLAVGADATTINANGATVIPGLIDSHVHPVIGDYSPRQKVVDFIASCVHGGVTRMISAGEVHMPGRPTGAIGTKAMAIVGAKAWKQLPPRRHEGAGWRAALAGGSNRSGLRGDGKRRRKAFGEVG